jgi:cytidylate kinase
MKNTLPLVITISRQLGSGGAYVGQGLAKSLDIFYADREIISQAAKQYCVLEKDLESCDEKKLSFWQSFMRSLATAPDTYVKPQAMPPSDLALFKTESEIITRIANERSAVIIGRCGSYILRDHPNLVSIFLHAGITFRKNRLQKLYAISEDAALKMIAQSDKERALYHRTVTGQEWADARRYNLSIATDKIGVDQCVEFILKYLNLRG